MKKNKNTLLTTGQAAKLCSVKPDTMLKWIKKGKIKASRTAGGHFRVNRSDMADYISSTHSENEEDSIKGTRKPFQFCWEYFALHGEIIQDCLKCLVYSSRTMRCWELSRLSTEFGFAGIYCTTTCNDCKYKQDQRSKPFQVILVTDDDQIKTSLLEQSEGTWSIMRFTNCEYGCSSIIDQFRPDYIVIDGYCFSEERCAEFCFNLQQDPRIPETKIIMLLSESAQKKGNRNQSKIYKYINKPFSAHKLKTSLDYTG